MLLCLWFSSAVSAQEAEKLDLEIRRFDGTGPDGAFVFYLVRPVGYLLDSQRPRAGNIPLMSGPVVEGRTYVLVWQPYSPDLFDWKGEESSPLGRAFIDHLHRQCYVKDPVGSAYVDHSVEETECYGRITLAHLRGESSLYTVHRIWGDRLEDSEFLGWFRYVIVFFSLVVLSLPALAISLCLIGILSGVLRARPGLQRAVKVLLPLAVGVGWLLLFIVIQGSGQWRGALASFQFLIPMGGLFAGLGFLPAMWMADHLYFPENDPPRLWVVILLYFIAPVLLAGAGAAGGSRQAVSSSSGTGASGGSSGGTSGGGRFGGGGASAQF